MTNNFTSEVDYQKTLELRLDMATKKIMLHTAMGNTNAKASWLKFYQATLSATDLDSLLGIELPTDEEAN